METCIVFDTSSVVRKVANRILSSEMIDIVEAKSGAETLALAKAEMPDYIIVDSNVTDMERDTLIRSLRALDTKNNLKIVTLLMQVDLASMTRAKRAGSDEFVIKPFNRAQLLQQFRSIRRSKSAELAGQTMQKARVNSNEASFKF